MLPNCHQLIVRYLNPSLKQLSLCLLYLLIISIIWRCTWCGFIWSSTPSYHSFSSWSSMWRFIKNWTRYNPFYFWKIAHWQRWSVYSFTIIRHLALNCQDNSDTYFNKLHLHVVFCSLNLRGEVIGPWQNKKSIFF